MKYTKIFLPTVLITLLTILGCKKSNTMPSNCSLEPQSGGCYANIPKYYFDREEGKCKQFIWGGCGGVVPFDSMEECDACLCND